MAASRETWDWKGHPPPPSCKMPLCREAHGDHQGGEARCSHRRVLLPWSSECERTGLPTGAGGCWGGLWNHGTVKGKSIVDRSLASLSVMQAFHFPLLLI